MDDLKIAAVQADLAWEDKNANFRHLGALISDLKEVDLVILPEMFSTGFSMNAKEMAEPVGGPGLQWMQEQAQKLDSVVCGSLITEEDGKYYNRLYWVKQDQKYLHYDKKHLFTYAGEHKIYSAGTRKLITELKGWKICPQVCYDLRFPAWNRNLEDYDVLLFIANWPERRSEAWKALLKARSIENMCYTIGVNRVGEDDNAVYHSGESAVIDPLGEILWQQKDKESVQVMELSAENLQKTRERFGFLNDRDKFRFVD